MSILGKALKIGVLVKVADMARREASKPENRQKAMDAIARLKTRHRETGAPGSAGGAGSPGPGGL